jgi:predicted nucleic acid-binding protein
MSFVDSNIFVYSLLAKQAPQKHSAVVALLSQPDLSLSSQVVNELATTLKRKGNVEDEELRGILDDIYFRFEVIDLISEDIFSAFELREQYHFSYWDSLIAATALRGGGARLYSEDMKHGLVVHGRMTIWNPFTHSITE